MGAGIYLVYPAFYTDVTDSYRLGRAGRLRTDLAGVYFNGLFILAVAGLYAVTGWEALILIIVVSHVDAARQLLPFLRLDGYYIVADLTGVPDLFSRLKPILTSSLPWKKTDPKVKELKLWARVVVTVWVVLVIPLLLLQLLMLLLHAPRIIATAWTSLGEKTDGISTALGDGDWLGVASGAFQSVILVLPILGIVLTFVRLGGRAAAGALADHRGQAHRSSRRLRRHGRRGRRAGLHVAAERRLRAHPQGRAGHAHRGLRRHRRGARGSLPAWCRRREALEEGRSRGRPRRRTSEVPVTSTTLLADEVEPESDPSPTTTAPRWSPPPAHRGSPRRSKHWSRHTIP